MPPHLTQGSFKSDATILSSTCFNLYILVQIHSIFFLQAIAGTCVQQLTVFLIKKKKKYICGDAEKQILKARR